MPRYLDGFIIPMQKRKVKDYLRQARIGARVWKSHGALAYAEFVAEDLSGSMGKVFRKMAGLKAGETVVFAFIQYRSRKHRDRVNAAVMKDPRLHAVMVSAMPFDPARAAMGGFERLVGW